MSACVKKGCTRRTFMDDDRCFDHASQPSRWFWVWFAFCGLMGLATSAVLLWAVVTLVQWVTAQ